MTTALNTSPNVPSLLTSVLLDDLLDQVMERWDEWRVEHPASANPDSLPVDELNQRDEEDYDHFLAIMKTLVPEGDAATRLALAADSRVWTARSGSMARSIEEAITLAIQHLAGNVTINHETAPTIDTVLLGARVLWHRYRRDHPLEAPGNLSDADSDSWHRIADQLVPIERAQLLALLSDERIWERGAWPQDLNPGECIQQIVRQMIGDVALAYDADLARQPQAPTEASL